MTATTTRIAALVIAIVSLAAGAFTLAIGMAAWHARPVQDHLVATARADARWDAAAHAVAQSHLARAQAWRPNDGALDELAARLALDRAQRGDDTAIDRAKILDDALAAARRATARRPIWPYGWLILAAVLDARGEHGDEWAAAIANAARLGPNEARVHTQLARWWLDRDVRADVRVAPLAAQGFDRALARSPQRWIDAADRAGLGETVCARDALPATARERCAALGWLPEAPSR